MTISQELCYSAYASSVFIFNSIVLNLTCRQKKKNQNTEKRQKGSLEQNGLRDVAFTNDPDS